MKPFNLKRIIGTTISLTALLVCGGSAELAAQITIAYPKSTSGYACVGDTIEVTATAAGIDDLVLPKSAYWSGDANDAAIEKEDGKITKRFYTYHPYMETDPTVSKSREFEFTIRYKNGTVGTDKKNIQAKSCLPSMNQPITDKNPYPQDLSIGNKYNLGIIYFEFTFTNPSSNPTHMRFVPTFEPDQRMELYQQRYSSKRQWEIRYHAIPTSDATYTIDVFYNEGDSLNRKASFGPYTIPLKEELGTLVPDATGYCPGNDIVFSLQLSTKWQEVMNQTINKDESKIGSCFDWSGSPAPVSFTRRDGDKYFFSTKAVGTSTADFRCKMSVLIEYQSDTKAKPAIDVSFTHTYDVPIVQPTYHEKKGFTVHEVTGCLSKKIDLKSLIEPGATVTKYRTKSGTPIPNFAAYNPTQSDIVYADISAPCPWTDTLYVNVDIPKIQSFSIQHDTLICAGETISFSATANGPITWSIKPSESDDDSWTDTENGKVHTRVFTKDVRVQAAVGNEDCGNDFRSFMVKVVTLPTVTMDNLKQACPYTMVNLSGTGGNNPQYRLYDLRNQKELTSTYLTSAGLTGYPMRPNDSLRLTYTASHQGNASGFSPENLTCSSSVEAKIIAHPLPPVRISDDGTAYTDGQTACVPREEAFTLTASGADSYEWLDLIGQTDVGQPNRSLELAEDSLIRVRGVENAHNCFDTFAINCVVSVEKANRVKSKADCPGTEICFVAEELSLTTYAWYDPDDKPLDVTSPKLCRVFQAGQEGVYTLRTQRSGCAESLPYTLTLYPAPNIEGIGNSPLCVGEELVINYKTGLPDAETPHVNFTKDGGPMAIVSLQNDNLFRYREPDVQLSDAGRYFFKVTTDNGCVDSNTLYVEIEEPAVVRIVLSDGDTVCEDAQSPLSVFFESGTEPGPDDDYRYEWYNDHRTIYDADKRDIEVRWERADNGPLYLTVHQNACKTDAATTVTVIPTPHLQMPQDTGICQGESICLTPVSDIEPEEFRWFLVSDNKAKALPEQTSLPYCLDDADTSQTGRYFVLVTHIVGSARCWKYSDTTQLTVNKRPDIRIAGPDYICDQSTVMLRAISTTAGTVRWHHDNSTDDIIQVSEAGLYTVTRIAEQGGCTDSASHYLEARPLPYFSLPPDTSICRGTETMIYGPEDMESYFWSDGLQAKDRLVDEAGLYVLTVERNGCPFTDSTRIYMTFCGQFHFPTAFTPNDNRVNDTWGAISAAKDEDMAEFDLMVFDRNGKKVFQGKRISEQWDGRYKGELCPPGVYMYSFKALEKLEGIKYQGNGTVTIIP